MLDVLDHAYSRDLHSRPKCCLNVLTTGWMHIELSDYDPTLILMGMLMIFPLLIKFETESSSWDRLEYLANILGPCREPRPLTEEVMRCLGEEREAAGDGDPPCSVVSPHISFGLVGPPVY